jgi:FkbM family methyltransferase
VSSAVLEPGVIDVYGSRLRLDPEDSLYLGSHDYELYATKLVMGLLRPGDIAVDVGAMIGYYTVILAKRVGPNGRVYAFEPDVENFALLESNVQMNGYSHVECRNVLVGAESGPGKLWRATTNRGDHRAFATADREAVDVEIVALDDVIDRPVDIVKIDVQGYEPFVLDGMRGVIERSPQLAMLVEFCPALISEAGADPERLLRHLRDAGFQ